MKNTDSLDEIISKSINELAHNPPSHVSIWSGLLHPFKLLTASRKLEESAIFQQRSHKRTSFIFLLLLYSVSSFLFTWPACVLASSLYYGDFIMLGMMSPGILLAIVCGYILAIRNETETVNAKLRYRINGKIYRKFIHG